VLTVAVALVTGSGVVGFVGCSSEENKGGASSTGGTGAGAEGGAGPSTGTGSGVVSSTNVGTGGGGPGAGGMGGMMMRNPCKDMPPPVGVIKCGSGNAGAGGGPPASCDIACTDDGNNLYEFDCMGWDCSCNYNGMHVCDCTGEGQVSCGDDGGAGGGGGAGGAAGGDGGGGGSRPRVIYSSCCG
jgi:hypothetical protein